VITKISSSALARGCCSQIGEGVRGCKNITDAGIPAAVQKCLYVIRGERLSLPGDNISHF
jgi:hypothetical protein